MWQQLSGRDKFRFFLCVFGMALAAVAALFCAVHGLPFHAAIFAFVVAPHFAFLVYYKVVRPASEGRQPLVTNPDISPGIHKPAVTFRAVAHECMQGGKPKAVVGYESLLDNLILPRWGDIALKDITHADLQRWISGLSADESQAAVIQAHQCMSEVLKYAIHTDGLTRNVAVGIELPA